MAVTLKNQNVLIVGASSGIGHEIARLLSGEGARVVAAARRLDRLEKLRDELAAKGNEVHVLQADASKLEDMQRLGEEVLSRLGQIDVLIYAAGTNTPDRAMTRLTPQIWTALLDVNLNGAYYITHAVLPHMRERKAGHLIYISSISGLLADVSGAAYQASKRGLVGFAHAIRVEEKENGIRTSVICPGLVDTELLEKRPVRPSAETLTKALKPIDVAELALAIAKMPAHVVIPEVQILPTEL
jgi:NADP-dependent 3-hydroxy acid dehydrogenase YdfG